ncbi:sensor domain-containing diguanylate cyclase [uncultured Pseudoalteromonas sp.]|mgnify:FL=1|uniref:GGDEF domain-containing protein n=1 Tax=unclassified Pseudoalteromonas TaxID=194690 RepID=UPI0030DD652B|tara:strand:+ start:7313 stop:8584 length:1272 start_codon:yes stop_codon:yes gene_type:complete
MNYASHVDRIKSFIISASNDVDFKDLLASTSTDLKKSAYYLFNQIIKVTPPYSYQDPHPISELFRLTEQSLSLNNQAQKAILTRLEKWWLEWHFVAIMNAKLANEYSDTQQNYITNSTHHPMRKHELSHYAKLFTILPMPICNVCSDTGDILKVNQRFIDVFGYSIEDVPNLDVWWVNAYPDLNYRQSAQTLWEHSIAQAEKQNNDIQANDYQIVCKNGEQVTMQISGISISNEFIAVFNDATERIKAQDILRDMAFLDSLTKIANRRRFDEKLADEFDRVNNLSGQLSIILIDIDNFKQFNDRYGHLAGDECLYAVAQKLADTVSRPEDFVARYGGEEFVVLLPQTDKQGALFVAEQIQKAIEMLAIVHEDSFTGYLSVSMGINTVNHHQCDDHLTFIQAADDALYYAKNQGRNCIALSPGK